MLWFSGQGIGQRPLLQLGVLGVLVGVQLISLGFLGDVLRHSVARQQVPYRIRRVVDPVSEVDSASER